MLASLADTAAGTFSLPVLTQIVHIDQQVKAGSDFSCSIPPTISSREVGRAVAAIVAMGEDKERQHACGEGEPAVGQVKAAPAGSRAGAKVRVPESGARTFR